MTDNRNPRSDQETVRRHYEDLPAGAECTCLATRCPLHGNCRACVAWHRDHARKPLPHCLRKETRDSPEGTETKGRCNHERCTR